MELIYQSARNDIFSLTDNEYFQLLNIDGQTAATADISALTMGGVDGDIVNNVQAQPRTIILDLRVKSAQNVEEAKRQILRVIKLKQRGTLYWTQNERAVKISGIVEAIDMPRWSDAVVMQITLHCDQPFWEDADDVNRIINETINLHYFTNDFNEMLYFPEDEGIVLGEYDFLRSQDVYNAGDVAVGMHIEIVAYGTVTNPTIYNADGEFFGVGYGTGDKMFAMNTGDVLQISTVKGEKSVKLLNGTSLIGKIRPQSTWLQLAAGDNQLTINSDDLDTSNMSFSVVYKQRYI